MDIDGKIIIYCFIITIFTYYSIKYFITITKKIALLDIPNDRSSHKNATPRGAEIVIGLMFFISMFFFETKLAFELIFPIIALAIVFGIVDDLKNISAKTKFLFIIIASFFLIYNGYMVDYIGNFLGQNLYLGYIDIPFTLFDISLNLIDGLDGLAGGVSSVILFTLLINSDEVLIVAPAFLLAILLGFLLLNLNPAKIFMGDRGLLFLDFVIAFLTLHSLQYTTKCCTFFSFHSYTRYNDCI